MRLALRPVLVPSLILVVLVACASARPRTGQGGKGGPGDACRSHADCLSGLLCEDATRTCVQDECTRDDCDSQKLGQGRCETLEGVTYARTCAYDGERCLDWMPQACDLGCQVGPQGASCITGP